MLKKTKIDDCISTADISRRILLKRVAFFVSGITLFPELLDANAKPEKEYNLSNEDLTTFQGFIEVVVPGSEKHFKYLAEEIADEFYGFNKYFRFLIKTLNSLSLEKFSLAFTHLPEVHKKQIVQFGTQTGILKKQVFNGAIYLLQLIVFSGLCSSDQSCDIIDFPGVSRGKFQTYSDVNLINANSITSNGNPL